MKKSETNMTIKEFYIKGINDQIKKIDDLSFLDLIYKLVMRADEVI